MPKIIKVQDLLRVKEKHQFSWYWRKHVPDSKKQTYKSNKSKPKTYFYLFCGVCHVQHWVGWNELSLGRTHCCLHCKGLPTYEKFVEIQKKYNTLWLPVRPLRFRTESNYKRSFYMRCRCGKEQWVRWNLYQQGKATGCRSCKNYKRTHGHAHTPIYNIWHSMKRRNVLPKEWLKYEKFYQWARYRYSEGAKFSRIDKTKPYGPDNCRYSENLKRYVPSHQIRVGETSGDTLLPIGIKGM